jgi:hypothetical protein
MSRSRQIVYSGRLEEMNMIRTIQLLGIAVLAFGPAACLDDSIIYDGGYGGVRPAKSSQPPQNPQTKPMSRLDPSIVQPDRAPWSENLASPTGEATLTVIHELEAPNNLLRIVDEQGNELCRLGATDAIVTYDFIVTTCGLER